LRVTRRTWGRVAGPAGRERAGGTIDQHAHPELRALATYSSWSATASKDSRRSWRTRNAWEEFIPFLDYDVEVRKVICSTNAIESLNARYRRAVRARGHLPTEQAAMKCRYLVTRSLDPTGKGRVRWTMRWKPVTNAFAITFGDRWPGAETY
jgi:transposase-like protein